MRERAARHQRERGEGWRTLERLYDAAAVYFAFAQVGGAEAAMWMARDYALQRQAFGRAIGSYQAIKHKLADCYVKLELARSNAYYGAMMLTDGGADLPLAAAAARIAAASLARSSRPSAPALGKRNTCSRPPTATRKLRRLTPPARALKRAAAISSACNIARGVSTIAHKAVWSGAPCRSIAATRASTSSADETFGTTMPSGPAAHAAAKSSACHWVSAPLTRIVTSRRP